MKAPPLVLLQGDEPFLVERALAEVQAEALAGSDPGMNRQVFDARESSPPEVLAAARTLPFLGTRRLVAVRNAEQWSAAQWKTLIPYLESPNPSTCLVFVAAQIDRRLGAGKLLGRVARVVECRRPKERDMPGWARRLAGEAGLDLGPGVLHSLVFRVGPDLQLLSREVEKLRIFAGEGGSVTEEDIEALVGDARSTTVFALCDALGQRDLGAAVQALRRLLTFSEPPPRLLVMIVRHFRMLWVAREWLGAGRRPNPGEAAAAMGVPPFAASKALDQARSWEEGSLRRAFDLFVQADLSLKTGGQDEVLEGLVLELCRPRNEKRPGRSRGA